MEMLHAVDVELGLRTGAARGQDPFLSVFSVCLSVSFSGSSNFFVSFTEFVESVISTFHRCSGSDCESVIGQ